MILSEAPTHGILDLFLRRNKKPSNREITIKNNYETKIANDLFKKTSEESPNSEIKKPKSNPSEFLNSIIHELKNPLNAIIGFSELLLEEKNYEISEAERAEYLKDINQSANDLNDLIHDLLDVNSATSGDFSVDLSKEIDVKNLIKRSIKLNYDYSIARGVSLKNEIADDVSLIKLDMKRMKQILANLISNAIKYSSEKTEIKISAQNLIENDRKYLQIIVADQGFGMTQEQIQLAFQKYKTIQNPNSGKVDSFGLGLPITKQLVELQKGTLKAESEPSKGTKIILKFPYTM